MYAKSTASKATSLHPAAERIRSTLSRSANAKGPGPSGKGTGSEPSGKSDTMRSAHGFSARSRKHEKTNRAFAAAPLARLLKAATGSAKNITPWRETTRSGANCDPRQSAASASKNDTFGRSAPRSRAAAISGSLMSRPINSLSGCARASASETSPAPHPTSIARAMGRSPARASKRSVRPAKLRSVRRHSAAHFWPTRPSQSLRSVIGSSMARTAAQGSRPCDENATERLPGLRS